MMMVLYSLYLVSSGAIGYGVGYGESSMMLRLLGGLVNGGGSVS